MNQTEIINPTDPRSKSPIGGTRVLIIEADPKITFAAKEWKHLSTKISILLRQPSVLCACGVFMPMGYDKTCTLRTVFYAVDSSHGVGDLNIRVYNIDDNKKIKGASIYYCVFAIALHDVVLMPLSLQRFDTRRDDVTTTTAAKVTTTSTKTGQKILRISVNKLKWVVQENKEYKTTVISIQLPGVDVRKIMGFNPHTCSDTKIIFRAAEIQKGSDVIVLRLKYPRDSQPPDSFVALLTLLWQQAHVFMRNLSHPTLRKLPVNGFRVQPDYAITARAGETISVTCDVSYSSNYFTALFLPYDVPGLDIHLMAWVPNAKLSIPVTALVDINLQANTPLGEIRFLPESTLETRKDRKGQLTAGQIGIIARGPGIYYIHESRSDDDQEGSDELADYYEPPDESDDEEVDVSRFHELAAAEVELRNSRSSENLSGPEPVDSYPRDSFGFYDRFRNGEPGPQPDIENLGIVRRAIRDRRSSIERRNEDEDDDFATMFKIRLDPLNLRLLDSGLAPFTFRVPATVFDNPTYPLRYTFLENDRNTVYFQNTLPTVKQTSKKPREPAPHQMIRT
uniref:Tegument protein pp65 n=1 Tax=Mastomys natalensis cytomegalovirus 2 TaxID=2973540 RepID=A0A9Y1IKH7_9BETA|nr:tegument protein pp65 [Mastomys natalensis cytomegalovirus 2]WEG69218.1 tegument protein pp65 [Mastomys natalensis cytomegalovirus 2]WEG69357.1 tegument protein pp65 [Mastomys natalensis cytomegalovirus 2]WEG69495.1 tegument protein pp65 [Mastomys natalensis cytomegalovirus 2]WEG69633.1 tegument protein pp65 [Mastomys natalensis cytomegalovirus 2]